MVPLHALDRISKRHEWNTIQRVKLKSRVTFHSFPLLQWSGLTCKIPSFLCMLRWECYLAGMQVPGLHVYFHRPSYFKGAWSCWHPSVPTVHLISLASKQAHCSCFFRKASNVAFPCVKELSLLPMALTVLVGCQSAGDLWVVFYPLGFYWVSLSFSLIFLSWLGVPLNVIYMKASS